MSITIALVGRPNVGKSRLFNRLIQRRISIVHNFPGTTRDIIAEELKNGVILMDTGGIGLAESKENISLLSAVEEQIYFAIQAADIIFFVVDARAGCLPFDYEIAASLRKFNKKVYLIVNKIDLPQDVSRGDVFHVLGFKDIFLVSAEHGYGEQALWEMMSHYANESVEENFKEERVIKICLLGRPNVGKSSIVNTLLKENRMIAHPVAGTTRDAIACDLHYIQNNQEYHFKLIDTAGLREKKKMNTSIEFFSTVRSMHTIKAVDVVFLVIDALSGITRQDKKLTGQILKEGKCFILVVNKWDLAYESLKQHDIDGYHSITDFRKKFLDTLQKELFALSQFPTLFISAKTGYGVENILSESIKIFEKASKIISTGKLNRVVQDLLDRHPPTIVLGKRFKIYYVVHSGTFPFHLKIFCNRSQRLTDVYQRYLENGIRNAFDLSGCPLVFEFIDKEMRYAEKTA
ncbi:MAG: ribosome biogenesis GTPase Der [Puniceicoccales bacterium]|jgi:GTP-binding protein|nr:ribosome biogenesis GTPase Der [Puniceicoccales bacterium]